MKTSIRKTQRNRSHAAGVALSLMVAVGLLAIAPLRAEADNYVTSSTTTLTEGTWIVEGTVTVSERIKVNSQSRPVFLRLNEGATLNAQAGINVSDSTSLTIEGTGTLNAAGSDGNAGIGGAGRDNPGTIIINGGTINASGSVTYIGPLKFYGAAIGSGYGGSGGSVTINGGHVTATGVDGSAGIGGDGWPVTLGGTEASDFIDTTGFKGTVGFAEGKRFYYADTGEEATSENLRGGRLLPLSDNARIIVIEAAENGRITPDKTRAEAGDPVTLTASSKYPWLLDSLTVETASGAAVDVERIDRTTCRFVMPDEDVVVTPFLPILAGPSSWSRS